MTIDENESKDPFSKSAEVLNSGPLAVAGLPVVNFVEGVPLDGIAHEAPRSLNGSLVGIFS